LSTFLLTYVLQTSSINHAKSIQSDFVHCLVACNCAYAKQS